MTGEQTDWRIAAITLDETSVVSLSTRIEQEREVAISDILENNLFRALGLAPGPYHVTLGVKENHLILDIALAAGPLANGRISVSLTPLRKVIKDYFLVCDSYFKSIRTASPHQVEALDMGRRALHDEGSHLLVKRLSGKVEMDFLTARRLFTLLCVLHLKA